MAQKEPLLPGAIHSATQGAVSLQEFEFSGGDKTGKVMRGSKMLVPASVTT